MLVFGERLQYLRNERGYNQEELGILLGLSNDQISSYERGKSAPTMTQFKKICTFFDVTPLYLLGFINSPLKLSDTSQFATLAYTNKKLKEEMFLELDEFVEYLFFKYSRNKKGKWVFILINIAICDDDVDFLNRLQKYLKLKLKNKGCIVKFKNGYDLLDNYNNFDVVFLDYEMPLIDGMSILDKIGNSSIKKIMVSNHEHIVFDTYKYNLYWFVRKKNLNSDIDALIVKLLNDVKTTNKVLKVNTSNKAISLPLDDIFYIRSNYNYVDIYTVYEKYTIRMTFKMILTQLKDKRFIIPCYGICVNMDFIKYVDFKNSYVLLYNGNKFNISKSRKDEVKEKYGQYITN